MVNSDNSFIFYKVSGIRWTPLRWMGKFSILPPTNFTQIWQDWRQGTKKHALLVETTHYNTLLYSIKSVASVRHLWDWCLGRIFSETKLSFTSFLKFLDHDHPYFRKYGPVVGGNRKLWFSFFTDFDSLTGVKCQWYFSFSKELMKTQKC